MKVNARSTLSFFDHFVRLPSVGRIEGGVGEKGPAPHTPGTALGGAGVLHTDRSVQEMFPLAEVAHTVPGDRLPKAVHEGPPNPLKRRTPGEFLEGNYVSET